MSNHKIPLHELTVAVENAVKQALAKHGAVPIDQLWVGFVAPDRIATQESAQEVASVLAKEGINGVPSVGQLGGAAQGAGAAGAQLGPPHRIIGIVYKPT
jgi:hypothetical protein